MLYNGIVTGKHSRLSVNLGKRPPGSRELPGGFFHLLTSSEVYRQRETCDGNQSHEQFKVRHNPSPRRGAQIFDLTVRVFRLDEKLESRWDSNLPAFCIQRERFRAHCPTIIQLCDYNILSYVVQVLSAGCQ